MAMNGTAFSALVAAGALVLGGGVGAVATNYWLTDERSTSDLRRDFGPWQAMKARSGLQDPFYIAYMAKIGPFANPPEEAIYLRATRDDSGEPLRSEQTYSVCGEPLASRFWSVAAYDKAGLFFETPQRRSSLTNRNVTYSADGRFCIMVGPGRHEGDWLPTAGDGDMQLLLRLYQPAPDIWTRLSGTTVPAITRVSK